MESGGAGMRDEKPVTMQQTDEVPDTVDEAAIGAAMALASQRLDGCGWDTVFSFASSYLANTIVQFEEISGRRFDWDAYQKGFIERLEHVRRKPE